MFVSVVTVIHAASVPSTEEAELRAECTNADGTVSGAYFSANTSRNFLILNNL